MAEVTTEITVAAHCALHVRISLWEAMKLRIAGASAVKTFLAERFQLEMDVPMDAPEAQRDMAVQAESDIAFSVTAAQEEAIGQAAWRWIEHKAKLRKIPLRLEREE